MARTLDRDRLLEGIQTDLKNLSLETRKRFPAVKESVEEAIIKIRSLELSTSESLSLCNLSNQILVPLLQGCETKDGKIVKLSLNLIQRLITHKILDLQGGCFIVDSLWNLMESEIEEVKILQTITLLVTSSSVITHESLSKVLVISFRLSGKKDIGSLGGATVRQLVPVVFERLSEEKNFLVPRSSSTPSVSETKMEKKSFVPSSLYNYPFHTDAYLLFQDIVLLIGGESALWLLGISELSVNFGLELLEALLKAFSSVFSSLEEFVFLLKEKVCPLVIKLFSPSIKNKQGGGEKPIYSRTSKLLRLVSVLIQNYHEVLNTETEIFLSLINKYLDPDKPIWQNILGLEVLHKIIVSPRLLFFIGKEFDSVIHSTNVFQDMINSLGSYVFNSLNNKVSLTSYSVSSNDTDSNLTSSGHLSSSGVTSSVLSPQSSFGSQPGFIYRDVWKPLLLSFVGGQTKELYLEVLDKNEPPTSSDGYGISLAYILLLDTVRSLSLLISKTSNLLSSSTSTTTTLISTPSIHARLIESSWCGLLAPLSLLLDASIDDGSTEQILKALESYASLCGLLSMSIGRDAYLAAICKASLPPHYTLSVLKSTPCTQTVSGPKSNDFPLNTSSSETDIRHQVVAVGTPLPTSSLPSSAHQGPVMLTSKNLQCMRSILSIAHSHGKLLGSSWHIVLTSLQHLVWILGLKPLSSGALSSSQSPSSLSENSSVITTAVLADLPILSNMVSRLFESSKDLDDDSLCLLIESLMSLSTESMELAKSNREPSLFAVAKLLETALVNLYRHDVIWKPITDHLLIVCSHPLGRMRQWGTEALSILTKQSLSSESSKVSTITVLQPLSDLSNLPFPDVRTKQLETLQHILHVSGEDLNEGWPLVLNIIGSLQSDHSESLIRNAFQSIQFIFSDFLPSLPLSVLPLSVNTAFTFGAQKTELNVSLTAIGLLWNWSDYVYQNAKSFVGKENEIPYSEFSNHSISFDACMMTLYSKLQVLCLDSRPSVRKSAGQTLFSTIAAHGSILKSNTWESVFWEILFPLLDNVILESDKASNESSSLLLIHHSRNTAQKQWAETKVLTISGVVRVFNTKQIYLGSKRKAWTLLLDFIEKLGTSTMNEVSLASIKALQELLSSSPSLSGENDSMNWSDVKKVWFRIGSVKTKELSSVGALNSGHQNLLVSYLSIFNSNYSQLEESLESSELVDFGNILKAIFSLEGEMDSVTILSTESLSYLKDLSLFKKQNCLPSYFSLLCDLFSLVSQQSSQNSKNNFGQTILTLIGETYENCFDYETVISHDVLTTILTVLSLPLKRKYYESYQSENWRVAVNVLLRVCNKGIPLARQESPTSFKAFWRELASLLEAFLFPSQTEEQKLEERLADEAIDCLLIELLRDQVLSHSADVPPSFLRKMVDLLNKGSIHSTMKLTEDCSGKIGLREDFARLCFETLLEFSLLETSADEFSLSSNHSNTLAITSLLSRFKEVLVNAIEDAKMNRNIPLQRQKTAEISFVLKAIATVISTVKKTPKADSKTWSQIIDLYPHLVDFTNSNSFQIVEAVKDALLEYTDLLKPL